MSDSPPPASPEPSNSARPAAADPNPAAAGGRSSSYGWLIVVAAVAIFAIAFLRPPRGGMTPQDSPAVGKPAPQIDLVGLTEMPMDRVETSPAGEVMLVHFWGTWCGPCKQEYPELDAMVDQLSSEERFRFVPISCESGPGETIDSLATKTQRYFQTAGIDSFSYADPRGVTRRSAAERLERSSMFFPTSILVDDQGKIAAVWEGYSPEGVEQMREHIERLLQ